jgi:AbiV family abortive infection protein
MSDDLIFRMAEEAKKKMDDMVKKFNDDPEHFEQNFENLPNVNGKGKRRTSIPHKTLSSLIKAMFRNSQRFRKDAEILLKSESYESSIVRLFESMEELTKLIILLPYYKKQEDVPKDEVDKLFQGHKYRLQEFARYFHDSFFGKSKDNEREYMEWFFRYAGRYDQDVKEKLIYVDWVDGKIHDPLDFGEIAVKGKDFVNNANKIFFENKSYEIDAVVSSLNKDPDFQKIMNNQ